MQIHVIDNACNKSFRHKLELSKETINALEKSTKLTYKEMTNLSIEDSIKLMKERGSIKKSCKLKQYCTKLYKTIGEKLGLLEKQHNIYTDID